MSSSHGECNHESPPPHNPILLATWGEFDQGPEFDSFRRHTKPSPSWEDEKLIGFCGVKLYPLSDGGLSAVVVDFLIDESYRKRGVGHLLESAIVNFSIARNAKILTVLPNFQGNAAFKALGWISLAKIENLVLEPSKFSGVSSNYIYNAKVLESDKSVYFVKSMAYRKWRFDKNPHYKYDVIKINDKFSATTKLFKDPISGILYGDILDISIQGNCTPFINQLLDDSVKHLFSLGAQRIMTWALPHTSLFTLYKKAGFSCQPQERYFCVKLIDDAFKDLNEIEKWILVPADAEIF